MKNKDIACLVRNAQRDPDSHFDALYRASKDLVYYLACGMLSDVGHAADITQEVMLKVYQNLGNLGAPEAYNGWLNRIVVNTINDHWKKTAHQDGGLLFDEISVDASAGHDQGFPSHYNNAAEKTSHARGVGMHAPNAGLPPAEVSLTMQIPQPLDELVDNQVVAQIVFNEIRALPKNQREALLLRYYSDLDTDEIARALGVSENTATVRL
ncbi:MAG: RNA polymerase sigma factor, partial [Actinomycetes bacterium]|nr:RNA polymerase sigma factor [Actinomycetes bacterium]